MSNGGDKERDEGCHGTPNVRSGSAVDVSAEEVVNWDIPFTREFEPIGTVPPVRVEMPICKA
jgi:hypothetical protein